MSFGGENPDMMREIARSSLDFSKCQFDRIADAYRSGRQVEFESYSPYVADHDLARGDVHTGGMTPDEAIGVAIARALRKVLPQARLISLYDEYNTNLSDAEDAWHRPKEGGKQLVLDEDIRTNFRKSIEQLLQEEGVLQPGDTEGKNFSFVSESSKIESANELVTRLEQVGYIQRQGEAIYFINPKAENPVYQRVQLRTAQGRWLCEALDASSYLDPQNLEITHLVILPNHMKKQQDKVWEMLRVLGIQPTNYHNIFFDEKMPPDAIADVIASGMRKEVESLEQQPTPAAKKAQSRHGAQDHDRVLRTEKKLRKR